jgi:ribosome-associated protein
MFNVHVFSKCGHPARPCFIPCILFANFDTVKFETFQERSETNMAEFTEDQGAEELYVSRTQLKKEDHARQKLGERLVGLSAEQLDRIDLPDELRAAVSVARKTTANVARRRHVKHVGSVLRRIDNEPIERALGVIDRGDYEQAYAFKKIEAWRDRLREGDTALIEEILTACPGAERQRLSQLARNARKEFEGGKGTKASKALFRYLNEVS